MYSFDLDLNQNAILKSGEAEGASGQFFLFTSDNKFIIKTMFKSEKDKLLKLLPNYMDHILKTTNNCSLMARIYGVFRIKSKVFDEIYLMVMQNTIFPIVNK